MKIQSGAIEAGVTDPDTVVRKLSSVGVGNKPFTCQLNDVGAAATVVASVGPTPTGPWQPIVTAENENASAMSDVSSDFYIQIAVTAGTTDADYRADVR